MAVRLRAKPLWAASYLGPRRWVSPIGDELLMAEVEVGPDGVDGAWTVEVPITDDVMMRVDIAPVIA